jgi:hypothetical protein
MAVVDLLSTQLTAKEAGDNINPELASNMLRETVAVFTPAADDTVASTYRVMRVPSNARMSSLEITAADAVTAGAYDVGLAYPNDVEDVDLQGVVIDADFFASAVDIALGPLANVDITFESGVYTLANSEKALWEAAGLSEDPRVELDIMVTVETTMNGGPTAVQMRGRWTH